MSEPIVHVVQHLRPGGIEALVLELARLTAPSRPVHVVSLEGEKESASAAWPRLRETPARLTFLDKRPGLDWRLVPRLARLFREVGAVAVHTHHVGPLLYGGAAARLARVPALIHTEHDAWHLDSPRRRRLQGVLLRALRPRLVADAAEVAARLRAHWPRLDPAIIVNGVDLTRFCPGERGYSRWTLKLPQIAPIIGCAARLEAVKCHELLLKALARMTGETVLVLAGTGSREAELRVLASALGLGNRVLFLGVVDDMAMFYRAIDVFCLSSSAEGMPLSPIEAQACGTPVVLTDVGACRDIACPQSGRVVPAGDAAALANALSRSLAKEPAVSPRAHVRRRFDLLDTVAAYAREEQLAIARAPSGRAGQ